MAQVSVYRSRDESRTLFDCFMQGRIQEEAPQLVTQLGNIVSGGCNVSSDLKDVALTLTKLAVEFANSPQRQKVKEAAMQQGVSITKEQLLGLLDVMLNPHKQQELQERIIVALFFCFDYLMRLAAQGVQKMKQFLKWCKDCFVTVLEPIVAAAGGWDKIMKTAAAAGILFTTGAIVVGVALWIGKILIKS